MLEQTSLSIRAAIFGESPSVNPVIQVFSQFLSKIYTLYQDIFNQIFQEGRVAQSFKTGVITPILKKSKDQMLTENYSMTFPWTDVIVIFLYSSPLAFDLYFF
jgi:hypothetical protein